ncbi:nucleoside deaminase [Xanthomarina sp. F1114]|uniref:nucleoside deaminase n=1 Tax=Xanthomarina sp. F1114 TaxID=2996019 RepID=UPI00225DD649|nr:nucleoside deaminase [Xanthomarina sp. F1114]MCX7546731.1 nucleoside deaminase [Xanthomarina sp. F1114]
MRTICLTLGFVLSSLIAFTQSENHLKSTNNSEKKYVMTQNKLDQETEFTETDLKFLKDCLELAQESLDAGDKPFGSVLVNSKNEVIATARNRVNEKNVLAHPEIELAHWALENLSLEERQNLKMYTTGEHCPMCAGAHAWAQIGGLYYLSSAKQLGEWLAEFDVAPAPIIFIPAGEIIKNGTIKGPGKGELLDQIKKMHQSYYQK